MNSVLIVWHHFLFQENTVESKAKSDSADNQEINKENMATAAAAALAAAAVKSKVCAW